MSTTTRATARTTTAATARTAALDAVPTPPTSQPTTQPTTPHDRADALLLLALSAADERDAESLRDEAVLLTLDLPEQVARRYAGRGIEHDDLVQVGRLGLVKAAAGYRAGIGSCFAAYAMPTISGEVKRHFRDCGWSVRPPRRLQEVRALLGAEEEQLAQQLHRTPTRHEVAERLGIDPSEVTSAKLCGSAYSAVSLDEPDDRGAARVEVFAQESADIDRMLSLSALQTALGVLTDRELLILRLRFVEERTQSEIGRVLGVSQMQVSRLLTSILATLREGLADPAYAA
ncbi:RNA polymerase sigma-B factor [Phycicoccus badiiscoriae]|uniref:RNA polymerase sigma-B factor n=1 Tax=Pedococcus badiiscoriae TaxID=642776 RepID=A0A852WGM3_9MICO|nr:sigma-70 family RNA polymerase sigma factor [Pedococcus badiiscoriae]NYG05804.1 RNA polymerase sigma-B factor [Pedococcus badiiscoriae]